MSCLLGSGGTSRQLTRASVELDGQTLPLEGMSRDELLDLKIAVEADIDSIETQLQQVSARAREEGIFADRSWYQRASVALRCKKRETQRIQLALAKLKADRKVVNAARDAVDGNAFRRAFLKVAREHLAPDEFERWISEANRLVESFAATEVP